MSRQMNDLGKDKECWEAGKLVKKRHCTGFTHTVDKL